MKQANYTLPEGCRFPTEKEQPIGTYGTRYLAYLERQQPMLLFSMKLIGILGTYLKFMDEEVEEKYRAHLLFITEAEGITEHLKAIKPRIYERKLKEAERRARALTEEEMRWMEG
jgi:hypothetical protein